jgi:hypothetical protein
MKMLSTLLNGRSTKAKELSTNIGLFYKKADLIYKNEDVFYSFE